MLPMQWSNRDLSDNTTHNICCCWSHDVPPARCVQRDRSLHEGTPSEAKVASHNSCVAVGLVVLQASQSFRNVSGKDAHQAYLRVSRVHHNKDTTGMQEGSVPT